MNTTKIEMVEKIARYYIENNSTVRKTADKFGISKSTVHLYLRKFVPMYFPELFTDVEKQFSENIKARHLRGGLATKKRYEKIRKNK